MLFFLSSALKQDFGGISGGWETASQLGNILCQSCVGLTLPEVKEYEETFLPDVVENLLTLAAKLLDFSVKVKVVSVKDNMYLHSSRYIFFSQECQCCFYMEPCVLLHSQLYYTNTNEIPGELSRKNLIITFTCENITIAMAT